MIPRLALPILALAIGSLLAPATAGAEGANAAPRANITTQVRVQERAVNEPGKPSALATRAQLRVDGWVDVTEDGCLKVRGRITTGPSFNNEWFDTGIGANNDSDFKLAVRHLYIDATCLDEKMRVELGALPVRTYGQLGLTAAGWIDGLRVTVTDTEKKREWNFSLGQVGNPKQPNAFDRKIEGVNHIQFDLKQTLGSSPQTEKTAFVSIAKYKNNVFTRVGLEAAIKTYIRWLNKIGAELMMADDRFLGGLIYTTFDLGQWKNTRLFYAKLSANQNDRERLGLLFKNFYGFGDNVYLEANREISKSVTLNLRGRVGDAGVLGEAGITVRFSKDFRR